MEDYNGIFEKCEIGEFPINDLGFEPNKCLGNSYKVAKEYGALMVEGLFRINPDRFVVHAWNKLGETYIDATKIYVFETEDFIQQLHERGIEKPTYEYVKCCEYPVDESNRDPDGNVIFKYSYDTILDIANSKKKGCNKNE